jgi:poly-gamma-glutamate capsule biosynthesis protein CapA/YwtB (metallophosphatase superfamily)
MIYESENCDIQMAITGDSLITRAMSVFREERFLKMVELLRNADVSFTNAEMLFNNYEDPPTHIPGGTYLRADPKIINELQWLGIDIVGCANNHAYDFGENGVLTNIDYLDAAGLPHAGTGRNLGEASAPRYIDTPKGRVALISTTTSGPPGARAQDQWRDGMGRPGANMIRYTTQFTVDRTSFDAIRRLSEKLGFEAQKAERRAAGWHGAVVEDTDTEFYLPDLHSHWQYPVPNGYRFVVGETFATHFLPNMEDIERNLQRIRDARRMADWVIVSLHNHEDGTSPDDPSDMVINFAKDAIDAGADVFAGHGPHRDRGIEIYKGRPILYSLGHLILENETVFQMPLDNMLRAGVKGWEGTPADFYDVRSGQEHLDEWKGMAAEPFRWRNAIATITFTAKKLKEIRLYPIDLGFKRPRSQRGRPLLAEGEVAQEVLQLFKRLSEPFGTKVDIEDNQGVIRFS